MNQKINDIKKINKKKNRVILKYKNQGLEIKLEVEEGLTISEALRSENQRIETPCNCLGTCKKCKVKATGNLSPREESEKGLPRDIRLSCRVRILGDVEVEGLEINDFNMKINEKEIKLDVQSNFAENDNLKNTKIVLAIDLGTTGVSARLIDMEKKEIIGSYSGLNYQSQYGADVLSRTTYAIENGVEELKTSVLNQIKDMVEELTNKKIKNKIINKKEIIKKEGKIKIDKIAISGNTTMQHLVYGENPKSLAISPYKPVFLEEKTLFINGIETILLPSASSYVGADIICGVVDVKLIEKNNTLFIDIGTNGEIVFSSNGKLYGTSTAAGPAFEGMNIECGMRASKGAIEKFTIEENNLGKDDLENKKIFNIKTIENTPPTGICGSGLMDIMSELVKHKIVLKSGKLNPRMDIKFKERLKDKRFYITEDIYLSQKDIRQIQLAKGAIAAGIQLLLASVDKSMEDVEEVIIAGSFGYHLNPESILNIGIIPNYKKEIKFVGNSSLDGCIGYLTNDKIKEKIRNIKINVIELSRSLEFQDVFVKELRF